MVRRQLRWAAVIGVIALGSTACGTRADTTPQPEAAQASALAGSPSAPVAVSGAPQPISEATPSLSSAVTSTPTPAKSSAASVASGAVSTNVSSAPAMGTSSAPKTGGSGSTTASGGSAPGRTGGQAGGSPLPDPGAPKPPAAPGNKEPIVLGNIGTFSGPVGTAFAGVVNGIQTWARAVNDAGGIEGHPVKVLSVDDGADPARSKANVQDLVEHRGAVAMIGDVSVATRQAHSQYLLDKRVPVIGGEISTPEWYTNPMYFANGSNMRVLIYGTIAEMAATGKKKLAVLYCAEVAACSNAAVWAKEGAKDYGIEVVNEAKVSIAQPDYTAECLRARNSDADTVWPAVDPNSTARLTTSCSRQGYRPLYLNAHSTQSAKMATYDGIEGGMIGTQAQAPWFLSAETPGTRAFRDAIQRYDPSAKPGQEVIMGWTSGKLLEKALSHLGGLNAKVTSADILRGLWQIQNETLDGLTPPLTFHENQPSPFGQCWFADAVVNKQWVAPHGASPVCTTHRFA